MANPKHWSGTRFEPSLDEILSEPIVQMLMRRDRVDATHVRHLMARVARARHSRDTDDARTDRAVAARGCDHAS